jgi:Flp pilus assembly pilin Flp
MMKRMLKNKRGASLVEYALLVGGVALIGSASVSLFGHKTNDLIATVAAVLPGAHADDNGPIASGKLIETTAATAAAPAAVDFVTIVANEGNERLGDNIGATNLGDLVVEVP